MSLLPKRIVLMSPLLIEGDNAAISFENPDNITPPSTDAGAVINYKWSFSNSVEQLYNGGWIRVQVRETGRLN